MFFYSYSASVCSFYSGNPMANIFPSIREENIALDFQTPISALTQSNFMHKSKNGSFVTFCLCFPYSNCETNYMTKAFSKHLVFPLSKVKLNTWLKMLWKHQIKLKIPSISKFSSRYKRHQSIVQHRIFVHPQTRINRSYSNDFARFDEPAAVFAEAPIKV